MFQVRPFYGIFSIIIEVQSTPETDKNMTYTHYFCISYQVPFLKNHLVLSCYRLLEKGLTLIQGRMKGICEARGVGIITPLPEKIIGGEAELSPWKNCGWGESPLNHKIVLQFTRKMAIFRS